MNKLRQAWDICHKEGAFTLIGKSSDFIKNKSQRYCWNKWYRIKSLIFGNGIVKINGVSVDLNNEVFSQKMKNIIRKKGYESAERNLINKHICTDQPAIDLGAGVGYTACVIDRKTDDSEHIVAVEANKQLIPVIERSKSINKADFDILHSAYDPKNESIEFRLSEDFWAYSQSNRRDQNQTKVTVPAVSISEIIDKNGLRTPIQLVVDIEGGEHNLFTNESRLLQNDVSIIIFEYHSFAGEELEHYLNILEESGFSFVESRGEVYVYENTNR